MTATPSAHPHPHIDAAHYRQVLGRFASGVTVITALHDDEPVGLAANSFTSVSLEPPLVLFCAGLTSSSWPRIKAAGHYCVNVLSSEQEAVSRQFAGKGDKYEGIGWTRGPSGAPILNGVLAWIDCTIESVHDAGDHVLVVGRVLAMDATDGRPLTYFRGGYGSL